MNPNRPRHRIPFGKATSTWMNIRTLALAQVLLTLLTCNPPVSAQQITLEGAEKDVFVDMQNWNYERSYGTQYEIDLSQEPLHVFQVKRWHRNLDQETAEEFGFEPGDERKQVTTLPRSALTALVAAINDTSFNRIQPQAFGFSADYLAEHARRISKLYYQKIKKEERQCLEEALTDVELVESTIPGVFGQWMTSDYPTCGIEFHYPDDTVYLISKEQAPYMLPWTIDQERKTYNPMISTFFASIIPDENYSNKLRLTGRLALEKRIANRIYARRCEDVYRANPSELHAAEEILLLKRYFEVDDLYLGGVGGIDWELKIDGPAISTTCRDQQGPPNLIYRLTFAKDSTQRRTPAFIDQFVQLHGRVAAVPFLIDSLQNQANFQLTIHFVDSVSFGRKAREIFLRDAPKKVSRRYASKLDEAVLVTCSYRKGFARWLLFPNGDNLLWHYSGRVPLAGFEDDDLRLPNGLFSNVCKRFSPKGKLLD